MQTINDCLPHVPSQLNHFLGETLKGQAGRNGGKDKKVERRFQCRCLKMKWTMCNLCITQLSVTIVNIWDKSTYKREKVIQLTVLELSVHYQLFLTCGGTSWQELWYWYWPWAEIRRSDVSGEKTISQESGPFCVGSLCFSQHTLVWVSCISFFDSEAIR
jgi:hypothetical protein